MRASADVVVAGLGVLGAAAARALAQQGADVVGLDRYRPPHDLGSSHGESRIIRRIYPEGDGYVALVERAYQLWRQLERDSGESLLSQRGSLYLGSGECQLVTDALACARRRGLEHELLGGEEVRRRFPELRAPDEIAAVLDPEGGVLRAERCHEALLSGALAAGAELRYDCPLDGWRVTARGVEVRCGGRTVSAGRLLVAAGAWLPELLRLPVALEVERQVQHWFAPPAGERPATELPPFVWQLSARRTWYGLPDLGNGLKAAIHHGGQATRVEQARREVDPSEVAEVRRLLERFLPRLAGPGRASRVCLYTNTADHGFVAGPLPGERRVWVLGGGSGHAFKFAPALGELVAAGIAGGRPPEELSGFSPSRATAG